MLTKENSNLRYVIFILILYSISSCYENVEGCLDPDSSNYDVTADIECDDCCKYPQLSMLISHRYGDDSYQLGDTVVTNQGKEFAIDNVHFYFNNFVLNSANKAYHVENQIELTDNTGMATTTPDDILLVNPSTFRYSLGTFTHSDKYLSLTCSLGVGTNINSAQEIIVESGHSLAIAGDSLYHSPTQRYISTRILLRQIGVHSVPDTILVFAEYDYQLDIDVTQERGADTSINIHIDYMEALKELDYTSMTKLQITEIFKNNLREIIKS